MVKAMEKEHVGGAWITLDENGLEGTIAPGESKTFNYNLYGKDAFDIDNKAKVAITSNDPINPAKAIEINLHMNQGPELTVDSEIDLSVMENDTIEFIAITNDEEGDDYTFTFAEDYDFLSMSVKNDTLSFVYSPDYFSAGVNTFTLVGTDAQGCILNTDILINVKNINRAPELVQAIETIEYYQDEAMETIDLTEYFVDPDREELSFDFVINDITIANIYTWNKGIMIEPMMDGQAEITVTASDVEGLSSETTFSLFIGTVTGIEDVEGNSETKVYPVPTSGPLNIVLGSDIEGEVSISIINVTGLTLHQTTVNKMSGEHIERLNISNMPSGIYLVKITSAKGDIVKRVVKI
jgi:hypothetical protein